MPRRTWCAGATACCAFSSERRPRPFGRSARSQWPRRRSPASKLPRLSFAPTNVRRPLGRRTIRVVGNRGGRRGGRRAFGSRLRLAAGGRLARPCRQAQKARASAVARGGARPLGADRHPARAPGRRRRGGGDRRARRRSRGTARTHERRQRARLPQLARLARGRAEAGPSRRRRAGRGDLPQARPDRRRRLREREALPRLPSPGRARSRQRSDGTDAWRGAARGRARRAQPAAARAVGMDDVVFLRAVANVIAVVMARARAEERRRRSEEGLSFLAEAGHILAATLDYDTTLSTLASLVVPRLADWFIVDLAEDDGTMRRVAVAAAQPEKQALLEELSRDYSPRAGSPQPAALALERGGTVHFPDFTPESLRATTRDERHFELMTKLDPRSAIAVPLVARGRTLGALTFAWAESGRRYEDTDLALAEEVARRAAVAIDNARLYRSEQAVRSAAEEAQRRVTFVAEASATLSRSLDYAETLGSLARLAVPE